MRADPTVAQRVPWLAALQSELQFVPMDVGYGVQPSSRKNRRPLVPSTTHPFTRSPQCTVIGIAPSCFLTLILSDAPGNGHGSHSPISPLCDA